MYEKSEKTLSNNKFCFIKHITYNQAQKKNITYKEYCILIFFSNILNNSIFFKYLNLFQNYDLILQLTTKSSIIIKKIRDRKYIFNI